ncbi:hypothetical protein MYCTH_2308276 [Thermothelomyces thermophilus ATCC 42464]|uniref:Uncharacterized protein n=1 Tax=Thermothelomyces thermophilus (strain ATCC 42464 / BCRC 31852 / DSM 1799) TaxID=573729 RepID=G2QJJ9_THET4|nr:uncharacterized protein MYCTH_2308276 [Thermothelomyces thermophilus ATCC 42464]AEO59756.1 hypothetical protein MYCTH_2308276 [Thermothelomyces thermophilus ATCC 42464]
MTSSPTPRDIRRLASDHDFVYGAHPAPRRLGWWPFVATHLSLPAALIAGIIFVVVAIAYTSELSQQMLECPQWANHCRTADDWTVKNLGTVQGIITMVYMIGMASLAYAALGLCEATVWPLLKIQSFTINGLNAYLSVTRGSVMLAPRAVMSVRSTAAGFVLACALVVTLLPFAAPPLIGHAYSPTYQAVELESNYTSGGGISELYAQTNPATSVMVRVLAEYNTWATEPSSEPMPEYRDWYIDRAALDKRGDFTATAVRFQTSISCRPRQVEQLNKDNVWWNAFRTNLTHARKPPQNQTEDVEQEDASTEVWVSPQAQLTLWADSYEFVSDRRTRSTLVFAALNGTIEGGSITPIILGNLTTAFSVACDVEIEAVDDVLSVGNPPISSSSSSSDTAAARLPVLSSTETLALSPDVSPQTRLNELLLWFAVAPLLTGISVDGTQPMFANSSATGLPLAHTTSSALPGSAGSNHWTIPGLEAFIRLSIGALAQATTATANGAASGVTVLTTSKQTRKLERARALLLVIPPGAAVLAAAAAGVFGAALHARLRVPVMRLAGSDLGEVLKSSQTAGLREVAGTDAAKPYLPHELGAVRVRYGVDPAGVAGFVDVGHGSSSSSSSSSSAAAAAGAVTAGEEQEKEGKKKWARMGKGKGKGEATGGGERGK